MDTILVVDDEAFIAEGIALFLGEEGLAVLTERDGEEALTIALREHPRLVLKDIMMPRLGGMELCRRIHEDPSISGTTVLLMSSVLRIDLWGCAAAGLVHKPFDLDTISETVHRHLGAA